MSKFERNVTASKIDEWDGDATPLTHGEENIPEGYTVSMCVPQLRGGGISTNYILIVSGGVGEEMRGRGALREK